MKHALLVRLIRALQKKDKGFLFLDTHAGRGGYDLESAASGTTLARKPEWPEGIGRLWTRDDVSSDLAEYVELVRAFDQREGNLTTTPRFYPGSPRIAQLLARPQDRLALCEKQPAECAALRENFDGLRRVSVQEVDGYGAPRALLPPAEKRALVLIDPPFEAQDEWARIVEAVRETLQRLPAATVAIWFPITERARVNDFFTALRSLNLPPSFVAELTIADERSALKMIGCGVAVLNPPWQFDREAEPLLAWLGGVLAQAPGAGGRIEWLVRES